MSSPDWKGIRKRSALSYRLDSKLLPHSSRPCWVGGEQAYQRCLSALLREAYGDLRRKKYGNLAGRRRVNEGEIPIPCDRGLSKGQGSFVHPGQVNSKRLSGLLEY
jgi:hypothetical protein